MASTIRLSQLAGALSELTGKAPPPYRTLYNLVVDNVIPAESVNGRWWIDPADLRPIAEQLGMIPPAARFHSRTWPSRRARRRTSPAAA